MVYETEIMSDRFTLDPRIAASSFLLRTLSISQLRLQNDSRWPWLVLVPEVADAREIIDLSEADQALLLEDIRVACDAVKTLATAMDFKVDKLNVANLGNIVAQLHVHVIARNADDAAWPGPVWGFGTSVPLAKDQLERFVELLT